MWHRVTIKSQKPLVAQHCDQGFLVYAYIMQKNRAEPHASHATFEGLFEQINRRSQYALVGISLCAALTQAHASNRDGDNRDYERP